MFVSHAPDASRIGVRAEGEGNAVLYKQLCKGIPAITFRYRSIGATIGANLRFIGAIGAIIGANIEFIGDIIGDISPIIDDNTKFIGDIFYDIIYDTKRFTMTLVLLSMTSNIGNTDSNNQSNFFNSSTSGRASRNFSGISSLRR